MKKVIKRGIFGLIGTLALLTLAVLGVYFSPGLQRQLVLGVLEGATKASPEIEAVRIRLSGAELRGFELRAGQESLRIASVDLRFSLWSLLRQRPQIDEVTVTGLQLDLAAQGGKALAEAFSADSPESSPENNAGPMPFHLGKLRLDGTLQLPADLAFRFDLKADGIRPGGTGAVELQAAQLASAAETSVGQAEATVTLAVHQTAEGDFRRIGGDVLVRLLETRATQWLDARLKPHFEADEESFRFTLEALSLSQGALALATGSLEASGRREPGGRWQADYAARLEADLAAIALLSLVGAREPPPSARLDAELKGQLQSETRFTANGRIELSDLRPPRYSGRALSLRMEPRLEGDLASSTLHVSTPLQLLGPSTLTTGSLDVTLQPGSAERLRFALEVALDALSLEEWKPLVDTPSSDEANAAPSGRPDISPPWAGLEGEAVATLGRLEAGGQSLREIRATARVVEGLDLTVALEARSGPSPLTAEALVKFDPTQPRQRYAMTGALALEAWEVTPLLRPADAAQLPILEGTFDATGDFQANAPTLVDLAQNVTGEFRLQSVGKGIVRPLGARTRVAEGVSGLLGALAGNVREVGWAQEVINQLKEIPYTQLTFRVARDPQFDLGLHDFDLISRETRLQGNGRVTHLADQPLLRWPLEMRFELSAKGRLADALRAGRQLRSEEPDALGFRPGPPLPLRGSLAQPESLLANWLLDSSQQWLPNLLRPPNSPPPNPGG